MIAVLGQCRSGTSMTMQMLAAAGLVLPGQYPAFEDDRAMAAAGWDEWWDGYDAVKFVDPHDAATWFTPERFPKQIYCRRRNTREQGKSLNKFGRLMGAPSVPPRLYERQIKQWAFWYEHLPNALELVFEDTLRDPVKAATKLVAFIGRGDVETVAAVVRSRDPRCYDGMLELEL